MEEVRVEQGLGARGKLQQVAKSTGALKMGGGGEQHEVRPKNGNEHNTVISK